MQLEETDWWDSRSNIDKNAINNGIKKLDEGLHLTQIQVREKLNNRFNLK